MQTQFSQEQKRKTTNVRSHKILIIVLRNNTRSHNSNYKAKCPLAEKKKIELENTFVQVLSFWRTRARSARSSSKRWNGEGPIRDSSNIYESGFDKFIYAAQFSPRLSQFFTRYRQWKKIKEGSINTLIRNKAKSSLVDLEWVDSWRLLSENPINIRLSSQWKITHSFILIDTKLNKWIRLAV